MSFKTVNNIFLLFLAWMLSFAFYQCYAQENVSSGILPAVNFYKKINNKWALNFKTEARYLLRNYNFSHSDVTNRFELFDLSILAVKKTGLKTKLNFGYLFRQRNNNYFHRFIQQYSITQFLNSTRLVHRISADQTISSNSFPIYRFRYRAATDFSLNGSSIDNNEFYYKTSIEGLLIYQKDNYFYEFRVTNMIGYKINSSHKLEIGLDCRYSNLFQLHFKQNYWFAINWYANI